MSSNTESLSSSAFNPLQRVSLNSSKTNIILDSDSGTSSFVVSTGSATSLYIDKFSNVGINTKSPGTQLEVSSNNGSCLRLRYGATYAYSTLAMTSNGDLTITPTNNITTPASLKLSNHNGTDTGLILGETLVRASGTHLNYTMSTPGHATKSTALVVDENRDIDTINILTASKLKGMVDDPAQTSITSLGTLSALTISGATKLTSSRNATSYTEGGALTVDGGMAVAQDVYIKNDLHIGGDLFVTGTSTVVDSTAITIDDNTMTLNASPIMANDAGFLVGRYQRENNESYGSITSDSPDVSTWLDASTITTIRLHDGSAVSGYYNDWWLRHGFNIRKIIDYDALTKTITVNSPFPNPPQVGSLVELYGHNFPGIIWNESNRRFATMFVARDSSPTLSFMDYADIATGAALVQSTKDEALLVKGGASIKKSLTVDAGIYGEIKTQAQPNITSLGTLTSLSVSGDINVANLDGTIKTAAQPNITSVGTLKGLAISVFENDALTISNTSNTNAANVKFVAKSLVGELGVLGSTEMMYMRFNDNALMLANTTGQISIGTTTMGYKLNVGGSFNAVSYYLDDTQIAMGLLSGPITAGTAVKNKVLTLNESLNASGINKLTLTKVEATTVDATDINATTINATDVNATNLEGEIQTAAQPVITSLGALVELKVGASTISATDATYLASMSIGTASGSKAMVLDSNKSITGVKSISLTESTVPLSMTNPSVSGYVSQTMSSDLHTLRFGVRGSINTEGANTVYWNFNNADRITMNTSGEISIGTNIMGYKLNIDGSINASSYYLNGTEFKPEAVAYNVDVVPGTASASKTLIVNAERDIKDIHSLTTEKLIVGTFDVQPMINNSGYIAGITPGQALKNKAIVVGPDMDVSGLSILGTTTLVLGDVSLGATHANYVKNLIGGTADVNATSYSLDGNQIEFEGIDKINGIINGNAALDKALVLGPDGHITGIESIGTTAIEIGGVMITNTQASYLTGITPGVTTNSKALVLNEYGAISGIKALTINDTATPLQILTNTVADSKACLVLASNIYSWEMGVNGSGTATNPGVAYWRFNENDRLLMNATGDIAIGTTSFAKKLNVGGAIDATEYYINGTKIEQTYITNVSAGTASPSKVLVLNSDSSATGIGNIGATSVSLGAETIAEAEAGYLTNITPGTAADNKAVVLGSTGDVAGIDSLSAQSVSLGAETLTEAEAGYLTNVSPGTAADNKAVVLGATGDVAGIGSLSATNVYGSIKTGAQPDITSIGTQNSSIITEFANDTTNLLTYAKWTNSALIPVSARVQISNIGTSIIGTTEHIMRLGANNQHIVFLQPSGNVSIGYPFDTHKLYIDGTLRTNSQLTAQSISLPDVITSNTWNTTGKLINVASATHSNTAAASTIPHAAFSSFQASTLNSTNLTTVTAASTLYIGGAPIGGTNTTITNAYSLYANGSAYVDGDVDITGEFKVNGEVFNSFDNSAVLSLSNVEASTDSTSGALVVAGGVGIGGALNVSDSISCGSLTIGGAEIGALPIILDGITPGTASPSKVLITDENTKLRGLKSLWIESENAPSITDASPMLDYTCLIRDTVSTGTIGICFSVSGNATSNTGGGAIRFERTGTASRGDLVFATKSSQSSTGSIEEKMRIMSSGNVGIGTKIPTVKLEVNGSATVRETLTTYSMSLPDAITSNTWGTTGKLINVASATHSNTAAASTITHAAFSSFQAPTLNSTNLTTVTAASTLYIGGAPIAGANTTITNPYALYVAGNVNTDGVMSITSAATSDPVIAHTTYASGLLTNGSISHLIGKNSTSYANITYGINGTTPLLMIGTTGKEGTLIVSSTGCIGINHIAPKSPLTFKAEDNSRKIDLYSTTGPTGQFYGIGVQSPAIQYHSYGTHSFFTGLGSIENTAIATEMMRITSSGVTVNTTFSIAGGVTSSSWGTIGRVFDIGGFAHTNNAAAGTIPHVAFSSIGAQTLISTNTTTATIASTLYISGAPVGGANTTITYPCALFINSGKSYFGGALQIAPPDSISGFGLSINAPNLTSGNWIGMQIGKASSYGIVAYNTNTSTSDQFLGLGTGLFENILSIRNNGCIGINHIAPNSPLTFKAEDNQRKIDLWSSTGSTGHFYGFGVKTSVLQYHSMGSHTFYIGLGGHENTTAVATDMLNITSTDVTVRKALNILGDSTRNDWNTTGRAFNVMGGSFINSAAAGTIPHVAFSSFQIPYFLSINTTTATTASTVYIGGAPSASAGTTITNPYALFINSGNVYFGGSLQIAPPGAVPGFGLSILAPSLFAGNSIGIQIGKNSSWYGVIKYNYAGISSDLYLSLGPETYSGLLNLRNNGCIGILNSSPQVPLQFQSIDDSRKLALYMATGTTDSFYGFGVKNAAVEYHSAAIHSFQIGLGAVNNTTATTGAEVLKITKTEVTVNQPLKITGGAVSGGKTTSGILFDIAASANAISYSPSYSMDHTTIASFHKQTIQSAYNTRLDKTTTVYIDGAPIAGNRIDITDAYALYVNSGNSYFADSIYAGVNIYSAGRVGIGTTDTESYGLNVQSSGGTKSATYRVITAGNAGQAITATSSGISIYSQGRIYCNGELNVASDKRIKKNICPLTDEYCDKLLNIEPQSYILKETNRKSIGFIAQDIIKEQLYDLINLVEEPKNELLVELLEDGVFSHAGTKYGVNYNAVIPILLNLVKRNRSKIDLLEKLLNQ